MDNSTLISLAALIVSIASLPTSYYVAVRQTKLELDEFEKRQQRKLRSVVTDRLEEFFKVFCSAVKERTGIEPTEVLKRWDEVEPCLRVIDEFVRSTGILDRLAQAIDDFAAAGYTDRSRNSDLIDRLQSIRGIIAMGSDANCETTVSIIRVCDGDTIFSALRTA